MMMMMICCVVIHDLSSFLIFLLFFLGILHFTMQNTLRFSSIHGLLRNTEHSSLHSAEDSVWSFTSRSRICRAQWYTISMFPRTCALNKLHCCWNSSQDTGVQLLSVLAVSFDWCHTQRLCHFLFLLDGKQYQHIYVLCIATSIKWLVLLASAYTIPHIISFSLLHHSLTEL